VRILGVTVLKCCCHRAVSESARSLMRRLTHRGYATRVSTVRMMDIHYGPKMGDFLRASGGQHDQQVLFD